MSIEKIIELFNSRGFVFEDISYEDKLAYYTKHNGLRISIFDHDYPNTGYCGSILVEHEDNFDKWSKAFYQSDFPGDDKDFDILMNDLLYVSQDFNKEAGNGFGGLVRRF